MISTKGSTRARGPTFKEPRKATREAASTRSGEAARRRGVATGVPRRVLADGVVERRRTARGGHEARPAASGAARMAPIEADIPLALISPQEHYRREQSRRAGRTEGDLASLLAEAKAEYEALINAPRPAGKGGRPRKKAKVHRDDEDDDSELDDG